MKRLNAPAFVFLSFALVLVLPLLATAQTAVPMLVNYQGELRSPTTGEPVADGLYNMVFRIYGVLSGGTALWTGTHSAGNGNPVQVTNGIFSVVLGSGAGNAMDASLFSGADRWLETKVGTETLSPRQQMSSVAYSIASENSRLLAGREAAEFANGTHVHSGSEITSGTVLEGRIDPLITRDGERDAAIAAHAAISNAHHARYTDPEAVAAMGARSPNNPLNHDKTTRFTELTDVAADAQIPATIARDAEVTSAISTHSAIADAHHSKTTKFSELTDVAADGQIPASIARDSEVMPTVLANDGTASGLDADKLDGAEAAALEESAEIDSDIAAHKAIAEAHHARYTNAEAVAAMGAKSDTNPLNHDKTTSLPWGSIASVPVGFADGIDNDSGGDITGVTAGTGLTGGGASGGVTLSAAFGGTGAAPTVARSDHNHDATYWTVTGNTATSGANFLGTTDNQALELRVNSARALRLEPNATSPNLIGGHRGNSAGAGVYGAAIGGGGQAGSPNLVTDDYGTIGGGRTNQAGDNAGTTADAHFATVAGGYYNTAANDYATVAGGAGNTASDIYATVGGGGSNKATGSYATVAGGHWNLASGWGATVAGGVMNTAQGNYSFAAGRRAIANHAGLFVWADSQDQDFASVRDNMFMVRCSGGVWFRASSDLAGPAVWWNPGDSSWGVISDRNLKENFVEIDPREVLERVSRLPITEWNFKGYALRHIGPVAQDFQALFPLGGNETMIDSGDLDGVALAAIQGLHEILREKDAKISTLEARIAALESLVEKLVQSQAGGEE